MHVKSTSPRLLIVLLIALLIVPTMAAPVNETEFLIDDTRYEFDKKTYVDGTNTKAPADFRIVFTNYQDLADIQSVFWKPSTSDTNFVLYNESITAESYNVQFRTYLPTGNVIGSGHLTYFKGSTTGRSHVRIDFNNIDTRLMINNVICVVINDEKAYNLKYVYGKTTQASQNYIVGSSNVNLRGITEIEYTSRFTHNITLQDYTESAFKIKMNRDGRHSVISIYDNSGNLLNSGTSSSTVSTTVAKNLQPYTVVVESTAYGGKTYTGYLGTGEPWIPPQSEEPTPTPTPTQTGEPTVMRTGTVTMTDNNGTTIRGFEVTAVNAYTEQSYTVVTETDVAVMNLPMDRAITLRNPQTGEYEDALVGYYRFYGQAPGYKMLNEDGIQVAVVPEKYSSYQLCDIGVTSESGYLTGKHQFQIRSRSDNAVLQTGTISAKSATTGEWYNTTVSGGLASLILPYDTSNPISQYAGNYYVYATSPGYEDSDYGTQIVVMPHTVSEIRDIHLTPIGGIPTPGNVTLRIQVFSETGPGVVNAEIFVAGVQGAGASLWDTYTASSTGYLAVSVPGNSTYDIVASGAGYYDSARRIEVFTEDPPLIEIKLYLSGAPPLDPTTQPTGWPTTQPTTQPTGGIPDEDDDSEGFLIQAVRGIGLAFGVGFATAKLIFGMLLALSIGYATAKQLRGGAAEFGLGLLGGTLLGVLIGLLPVWIIVVLLLVVGLYIGSRYVGGSNNG